MATELETITVHSDEALPIEFGPETHGISELIELPDGKRMVYIAPLEDLHRLAHPTEGAPPAE